MAAVCCSNYYQLWQLRSLIRFVTSAAVKTLVQMFISCCLDYCNSFYSISNGPMTRLQSVQNAATHLVSGLNGMTTTCWCYASCTGFWFRSGLSLRWPPWSTIRCLKWLQLTWLLTVSWSVLRVVVNCVLPTLRLVFSGNFGD